MEKVDLIENRMLVTTSRTNRTHRKCGRGTTEAHRRGLNNGTYSRHRTKVTN